LATLLPPDERCQRGGNCIKFRLKDAGDSHTKRWRRGARFIDRRRLVA
jgi:hypothetical protein